MNNKPLLSVVIPVYNCENDLSRSVEAVLAQSYEKIELILVNDGSMDNSLKICRDYEKKCDNIRVIDKPNGGTASARNRGLNECTGEFIGFVDSDDYIYPEMFETMINDCLKSGRDIAICNRINKYTDREVNYTISDKNVSCDAKEAVNKALQASDFSLCNKVYSRIVFEGYRLDESRTYEDVVPAIELLTRGNGVYFDNHYFYVYYMNNNSMVHRDYEHTKLDYVINMFKMADMVKGIYEEFEQQCDFCCISATNNLLDEIHVVRNKHPEDYKYVIDSLKKFKNSYSNNKYVARSTKIKTFLNLHGLIGLSRTLSRLKRSMLK